MLTNGGLEAVRALLDRAYLADLVERNLSVDGVHGNRRRGPSRHAAAELAVAPERLALVAAHPWDCAGGRAAGLPAASGQPFTGSLAGCVPGTSCLRTGPDSNH